MFYKSLIVMYVLPDNDSWRLNMLEILYFKRQL